MGVDLVTGGGGFIGSHLVDRLLARGRSVRVVDDFSVGRRANLDRHAGNPQLKIIVGDVAQPDLASGACAGVERVFHLAAKADIVPSIQDPGGYFATNVGGTFRMVEAAREAGVSRFVYAASSSCYGIPTVHPTPESAPTDPRYPYALTKLLGEQLVLHWARVYRLPAISLRFFNVYGPRARTSGSYGAVFGVFLAQLAAGRPLTIVGDGEQKRDFTHVEDAVSALLLAAESDRIGEVYNIGSGRPASINEIVRLLRARETVAVPKRPAEPDCTWADIGKAEAELDWHPRVSLAEGVSRLVADLEIWRDAPVWTAEAIADATREWFRYLGSRQGGES